MAGPGSDCLVRPVDIAMGFGPPAGDLAISQRARKRAPRWGHDVRTATRREADYTAATISRRTPFSTRKSSRFSITRCGKRCTCSSSGANWRREAGGASFLYPFLGGKRQPYRPSARSGGIHPHESRRTMRCLRERVAHEESDAIAQLPKPSRNASTAAARSFCSATADPPPTPTIWRSIVPRRPRA